MRPSSTEKKNKIVANYINRFSATSLKFTSLHEDTDFMEVRKFNNRLLPKFKNVVYMSKPVTLQAAQDKALQAQALNIPWMLNKNKKDSSEISNKKKGRYNAFND